MGKGNGRPKPEAEALGSCLPGQERARGREEVLGRGAGEGCSQESKAEGLGGHQSWEESLRVRPGSSMPSGKWLKQDPLRLKLWVATRACRI